MAADSASQQCNAQDFGSINPIVALTTSEGAVLACLTTQYVDSLSLKKGITSKIPKLKEAPVTLESLIAISFSSYSSNTQRTLRKPR